VPSVCHSPFQDGVDVQVHEPGERVLVHGVYVGQVGDAEEQNRGVFGDGPVPLSGLGDLDLGLLGDLRGSEEETYYGSLYIYSDANQSYS